MKKSELKVIIDKVRNRCGLEEPTKVTYDRNEDGQVIFRFYFDSLYLPPEMQFNEPKVLNTFVRKDLYEFKDEFQITKLDKKKGFVEVLPDDQHFKVVKSYKDAKEAQKDEESVHLHDGNRLNENFIRDLNLILREVDSERKMLDASSERASSNMRSNGSDPHSGEVDDVKKGKDKEKKVERTREVDIYVFRWTVPNAKACEEEPFQLIDGIINNPDNKDVIVLFGYPFNSDGNEQDDEYPSMMTDSYSLMYERLKVDNVDMNYKFGLCGRGINISKKLENVKKVNHIYDYTSDESAMQILKDANIQTDGIEDFPKEVTPAKDVAETQDPSKGVLEKILPLAKGIANKFTAEIRSKGKAVKQETKDYNKKLQEARTGSNSLKRALDFCVDVYGSDAKFDQDAEQYKIIKSSNLLLAAKYKKAASDPNAVIDAEKEQKSLTNQIIKSIYDNRGLTGELGTNKQQNSDAAQGGLIQRNVSIGRGNKNKPKEKTKDDVKLKAFFPDDFYVFCIKNNVSEIANYFTNEGKVELVFSGAEDNEKDKDKKTDDQNKDEKGTENTPKKQDQTETGEKTGDATPQAQGNTPQEGSGDESQGK